jgi:hypothetical protein
VPAHVIDGRAVAHRLVWLLHNAVVAAHLRAGHPTADIELAFSDFTAGVGAPVG